MTLLVEVGKKFISICAGVMQPVVSTLTLSGFFSVVGAALLVVASGCGIRAAGQRVDAHREAQRVHRDDWLARHTGSGKPRRDTPWLDAPQPLARADYYMHLCTWVGGIFVAVGTAGAQVRWTLPPLYANLIAACVCVVLPVILYFKARYKVFIIDTYK